MKNYMIIGGSSGIGRQIVSELEADNTIIATYNKHMLSDNARVRYIHYDIDKNSDFDIDIESLDGLVYCPGTINLKPFHRIAEIDFLHDLKINLLGAIQVIQKTLPVLKKSDQASIVLFSTVAVQQGMSFHSSVASSKGAIEGLTRSLAAEFAPKIRVNAIAPSIVNTPLASKLLSSEEKLTASANRHPLKKVGSVEDIARAAVFLLSDKSSWITGQILGVDGGLSSIKTF